MKLHKRLPFPWFAYKNEFKIIIIVIRFKFQFHNFFAVMFNAHIDKVIMIIFILIIRFNKFLLH